MKFSIKIYFLLSLLLVSLPFVSAEEVDITLINEKYYSGENIQVELRFLEKPAVPFSISSIKLKDQSGYLPIGFLYKEMGSFTFIYSQLPADKEGNFTLLIENIKFIENNQLVEKTFSKEFIVEKKPSLKTTPYILQQNKPFTINVKNTAQEKISAILIFPSFISTTRGELELNPGEDRNFFMHYLTDPKQSNLSLFYNDREYTVPLYYFVSSPPEDNQTINEVENQTIETNEVENQTIENKTEGIIFLDHNEITAILGKNQSARGTIIIKNTDKKNYFDIEIFLTGNLNDIASLDKETIAEIKSEAKDNITVMVNNNQNAEEGQYNGYLVIEYSDSQKLFPIKITIESEEQAISPLLPEENKIPEKEFNKSKYAGLFSSENKNKLSAGVIISVITILFVIGAIYFFNSMKKTTVKVSKLEDKFKRP